ncbi:MAG: hypothetical protein M5U15_03055 [Kiritimatiellae bacterium]|nr:hypothetical protein [Kiritimatiellia bacterium]
MSYFTRRILPLIDLFCVQTELDGERLAALGAPASRIRALGSAKYDVATVDLSGEERAHALLAEAGITSDHRIILGGSTWPGEENALMDAFKGLKTRHRNLVLILAPRHMERKAAVIAEIQGQGMSFVQRSTMGEAPIRATPQVFLLDTTGELKNFYSSADVIFVGKSLTQHGGQNPIEPALHGKAIICGPFMENFRGVVEDFIAADALVQVPDLQNLRRTLDDLLTNEQRRTAMGLRAAAVVAQKRGALDRTLELLDIVVNDGATAVEGHAPGSER